MFDLEQLKLLNRALTYSIAHLNEQADICRAEGRTHEAVASRVESERLYTLKQEVQRLIIHERIEQGRRTC